MEIIFNLPTLIQLTLIPLVICAIILFVFCQYQNSIVDTLQNKQFCKFQAIYFLPYFLALFSDWLQGPYFYKLYSSYGYDQKQIAIFYVVGFASSAVFGTATGPIADKFGRKKTIILFCLLYSLCCVTKLFGNFLVLLTGRILGGISTSILFSVFESWYIHEHSITNKYPIDWISLTFSKSTFFNGLLAIFAGLAAQCSAEWIGLGPVSPFILAIPFLIVTAILVIWTWEENYGEKEVNWCGCFMDGCKTVLKNKRILALGIIQSLFESNMYIFVFLWTPVLEPGQAPLGLTFASFMVAIMIGSSIYSMLLLKLNLKPEVILHCILAIMGVSFVVTGITTAPEFQTDFVFLSYLSFVMLEISVGMYYPCIGRLRGEIIPNKLRANIMNWFRVPMNIITCGALVGIHANGGSENGGARTSQIMLGICAVFSFLGMVISVLFLKIFKPLNSNKANAQGTKTDASVNEI